MKNWQLIRLLSEVAETFGRETLYQNSIGCETGTTVLKTSIVCWPKYCQILLSERVASQSTSDNEISDAVFVSRLMTTSIMWEFVEVTQTVTGKGEPNTAQAIV